MFVRDRRGNVAIIFALAVLPILAAVGCAVDYAMAAKIRTQLQKAADTASLASISFNGAGYKAAVAMTSNGTVSAGNTEATNVFNGNASVVTGYTGLNISPTVTKTGATLKSVVNFTAKVPTSFMGVFGTKTVTVGGSSTASASLPLYLDFYLMLDVSGSMGLPSTTAEAQRMQSINPDNYLQYPTGCTLACHFAPQNSACTDSGTQGYPTNNYCLGYAISRVSQSGYKALLQNTSSTPMKKKLPSNIVSGLPNSLYTKLGAVDNCPTDGTDACIQLRLDAVGYAVNQLFQTANTTAKIPNQFRIGLYPFIQYLYSYFPLTSSINGSTTNSSTINYAAANLATLLDTNMNSNLGSGGTHISESLASMNTLITSVGDGTTSNKTLPYVFLVTDGAQDPQTKGVPNGGWAGSNHATVINPSTDCTPMKKRGIIVSVLYIPYQKIDPVNTSFAGNEDTYANNNIANIPASLSGCASPGFFYTANTPADITAALNAMFNHAVQIAHITN
ncbi:TadE/TadG family type IV pilus assembly protein [Rhodopseudomonas sp. B29]|uniref:TadE/TadG family type IV pilus assembly protein n=1 Tax=Rhodopseudomonas sp. B29 TaxID=95607 RepID=UPI000347956B|nr:TadE/TadG family type IV pilus assembly protein [Rhodopseudomonas sp. B29]